jgi:hypothetical protein
MSAPWRYNSFSVAQSPKDEFTFAKLCVTMTVAKLDLIPLGDATQLGFLCCIKLYLHRRENSWNCRHHCQWRFEEMGIFLLKLRLCVNELLLGVAMTSYCWCYSLLCVRFNGEVCQCKCNLKLQDIKQRQLAFARACVCVLSFQCIWPGNTKGVSITVPMSSCLLVWNQLYDYWQFVFLFAKQTNPNQSNRRSTVQLSFPL